MRACLRTGSIKERHRTSRVLHLSACCPAELSDFNLVFFKRDVSNTLSVTQNRPPAICVPVPIGTTYQIELRTLFPRLSVVRVFLLWLRLLGRSLQSNRQTLHQGNPNHSYSTQTRAVEPGRGPGECGSVPALQLGPSAPDRLAPLLRVTC